jgi:prepilin-type N-terminal cleavage/methylation domain-containing protein
MQISQRQNHKPCSAENRGFSLLELILVLSLLGILGLVGTMGFVHFSRGFVFARETTATTAKGQLAMMRLAKELQSLSDASTAIPTRIAFTALRGGIEENHEVRLVGTALLFDNQVLVDQVSGLVLSYHTGYSTSASAWSDNTRLIDINLSLQGPDNIDIALQTRVAVRNM